MSENGVRRYRRKPDPGSREDQYAARYEPGRPLDALAEVARMADPDAELAYAAFSSGFTPVLVVRYERDDGDYPAKTEYEVVEPGRYLAYSGGGGFLYDTDDADWRQFYDVVDGERH